MGSPVDFLSSHFEEAKRRGDPSAHYAIMTTTELNGFPCSRVVMVRSIEGQSISLFVNVQSPKIQQLRENDKYELLVFWPLLVVQYRIRGNYRLESDSSLAEEWSNKSRASQIADLFHNRVRQQSTPIDDHQRLLEEVKIFESSVGEGEFKLPATVKRLVLVPNFVEQWIGSPSDRLHHRTLYRQENTQWTQQVLVP